MPTKIELRISEMVRAIIWHIMRIIHKIQTRRINLPDMETTKVFTKF